MTGAEARRQTAGARVGSSVRHYLASVWAKGFISPAAYAILTGVVLLLLGGTLVRVGGDAAAPPVGLGLIALGVWQLVRGLPERARRQV